MVVEGVVTTTGVAETAGAEELGGVKVEKDVDVSITVVGPMTVGGGDEVIGSVVTGVKLVAADAVATQDQDTDKHNQKGLRTRSIGHFGGEGEYRARRRDGKQEAQGSPYPP